MEGDVATRAHLGNGARGGIMDHVAGDIRRAAIGDGAGGAAAVGYAIRDGVESRVDEDVPAWVARKG